MIVDGALPAIHHLPLSADPPAIDQPFFTLGIETSGFGGSVALVQNGALIGSRALDPTGRRHARTLIPEIDALLAESSRRATDLQFIAVSIGPGSFTGLRVGVVCAKTLAWATGAQIIAVDSFLAIASQAPDDVRQVQVVGDGQRGDLYVGSYVRDVQERWVRQGKIAIQSADDWLAQLGADDVVSGPGLERHSQTAAARCFVIPNELWNPRAATVALLGEQQMKSKGSADDLWQIEPFYLRKSGAEEKADVADQADKEENRHES